jgi:adenylate cyclase
MSESMTPRAIVDMLNEYFPLMADAVFRHGGTLEKYIGDALMAVWGAPFATADDVDRAVAAAVDMQRQVEVLNVRRSRGGHPPIRVHIGMNTEQSRPATSAPTATCSTPRSATRPTSRAARATPQALVRS